MAGLVNQAKLRVERARARYSLVDIVVRTFKRFSTDDGGSYAAALTYYIFFSIFPLLLFAGSVIGLLTLGNDDLRRDLIDQGLKSAPLLRDALSPDGLRALQHHKGTLAITALVMALYAGTGAVVALQHALNKINGIEDEPNWFLKRARALLWLALLGVAAVISLAFAMFAAFAENILPGGAVIASMLGVAGGFAVGLFIFTAAFKFLPGKQPAWKNVLPGALIAAAAFELLKVVGSFYLARGEAARNDTFGTFASAAALLVASYLIAQITLLAAEVNAVLAERRETRQSSIPTAKGVMR